MIQMANYTHHIHVLQQTFFRVPTATWNIMEPPMEIGSAAILRHRNDVRNMPKTWRMAT